jgi:predicted HicB family RNase H-like nuclease
MKRRGRPREFAGSVSVRLPGALHDNLCQEALSRRMDVSDIIRERLARSANSVTQK